MSTEYQYDEELELYLNEDGDEFTEDEIEGLEIEGLLNEDESEMDLEKKFEEISNREIL